MDTKILNWLQEGEDLLKQAEFDKAISIFQTVSKKLNVKAKAYYAKGVKQFYELSLVAAFQSFQTVTLEEPYFGEAYFYLGYILEISHQNKKDMIQFYRRAITSSQDLFISCFAYGRVKRYFTQAEREDTLQLLTQRLGEENLGQRSLLLEAWKYFFAGDIEQSYRACYMALEEIPHHMEGYLFLIFLSRETNNQDLEMKYLELLGKRFSVASFTYWDLARLSFARGDFRKTLSLLHRWVHILPESALGWHHIGVCHLQQRNWGKARVAFETAYKLEKNFFPTVYNLGITYGHLQDIPKAFHYYKIALRYQPDAAKVYYNMAFLFLEKKDFFMALYHFMRAYKLDKTFQEAKENFAYVCLLQSQYREYFFTRPRVFLARGIVFLILLSLGWGFFLLLRFLYHMKGGA